MNSGHWYLDSVYLLEGTMHQPAVRAHSSATVAEQQRWNQIRRVKTGGELPERSDDGGTKCIGAAAELSCRPIRRSNEMRVRAATTATAARSPAATANAAARNSVSFARPGTASQRSNVSSTGASKAERSSNTNALRISVRPIAEYYRTQSLCARAKSVSISGFSRDQSAAET